MKTLEESKEVLAKEQSEEFPEKQGKEVQGSPPNRAIRLRFGLRFVVRIANRKTLSGKSKWGLSNGGLRPLSAICAQSSTILHFCGLFGPLSEGNFRHKVTTIVGNRGQLWTSTLSPHLKSPHLDFPDTCDLKQLSPKVCRVKM